MILNLENDISETLKENNETKDLINELSNYLNSNEEPIIEKILSQRKMTTGNENSIRWKEKETVIKFFEKNNQNGAIYFVKDNKKPYWKNNQRFINNDVCVVWKVENGKLDKIEINKKDMPKNIKINGVFRFENGEYIIEEELSNCLKKEIINMANEILNKQDTKLNTYRKEGHVYIVTGEQNEKRFLRDLTENSNIEFEETNLSKDILEKAVQGICLKYINGKYEIY